MGKWNNGCTCLGQGEGLAKSLLPGRLLNSNFLIQINIPIFHHSIIPFGLHETCSITNTVISISCRISETFKYIIGGYYD